MHDNGQLAAALVAVLVVLGAGTAVAFTAGAETGAQSGEFTHTGTFELGTENNVGPNTAPADLDVGGTAELKLNTETNVIQYNITLSGEDVGEAGSYNDSAGAHVHIVDQPPAANETGPIAIALEPVDDDTLATNGTIDGPTMPDGDDVDVAQLVENPESFYVNVHSTEYPAGVTRANLGAGGFSAVDGDGSDTNETDMAGDGGDDTQLVFEPADPTIETGETTGLNVTLRDGSGDFLNLTENVTVTTDFGGFSNASGDTITVSPAFHDAVGHAHVYPTSDEPGNATLSAEGGNATGNTTVTFVANDTGSATTDTDATTATTTTTDDTDTSTDTNDTDTEADDTDTTTDTGDTETATDDGSAGKAKQDDTDTPTDDTDTSTGGDGKAKQGDGSADGGNGKAKMT
jgi:hypothetical protein